MNFEGKERWNKGKKGVLSLIGEASWFKIVEISFPKEVKIAGYLNSIIGWKFLKLKKNINHEVQEIKKD